MRRSNLCDYSDTYIVVKGDITVDKETFEEPNNTAANVTTTNTQMIMHLAKKGWFLKAILHLSIAFQKLMD